MTVLKRAGELYFRPLKKDDLAFLLEVRNECREFLHDDRIFDLDEATRWFCDQKPDFWLIYLNEARIGYFRISHHSSEHKRLYLGADLHQDYRGKGLGFLAWRNFLTFMFSKYDVHKVGLEVLASNERAMNLYRKLGFQKEGVKRDEIFRNQRWIDSIIMSLLKSEWLAGHGIAPVVKISA